MRWTQWVHWIRWLRLCDELKCHYVPSLHRSCPSVQPQHYVRITPAVPCSLATISNWMPSLFGVYDSTLNPVCRPPGRILYPLPLCHRFDWPLSNGVFTPVSSNIRRPLESISIERHSNFFSIRGSLWNSSTNPGFLPAGLPQPVHITHNNLQASLHKYKVRLSHTRCVRISACSIYSADYAQGPQRL
jgi:hypothetical protein